MGKSFFYFGQGHGHGHGQGMNYARGSMKEEREDAGMPLQNPDRLQILQAIANISPADKQGLIQQTQAFLWSRRDPRNILDENNNFE